MFPLLPLWGLRSILQESSAEQSLKFEAVNDTDKKQITETLKCEELKRKLRAKYINISNGMIRTADIVAKLFQSEVLTAKERDEIQNLLSIPVKASEQLFNALMSKDDRAYDCFLTALIETDQKHITSILQNEDKYLDNEHSHMIRRHYFTLVDQLDVDSGLLLDRLLQSGALVPREVATIKAKPTRHEKTEILLDLVSKFSAGNFDKFLQALKESNHEHVISIMKDKQCIDIDGKIESEGFTSATDESNAQFKESSLQEGTQKIPALQSLSNPASRHKQQDKIRRGEDFRMSLLTMKRTSIRTLGSRFEHLPDELQTDVSLKVATLHQETVLPYGAGVEICYRELVEDLVLQKNKVNRKQTEVEDMREIVRRVIDSLQNSIHQFKEGFITESHILSEEIQLHKINRHLIETLKTTVVDLGNEKQKRKELETQLEKFRNESEKFEALLIQKDGMLSQLKHTQEQDAKVWAEEKDQLIVQMQELQKKYSEATSQYENFAVVVGLNDAMTITKDVLKINLHRPNEITTQEQFPTKMTLEAIAAVYDNTMYVAGIGDKYDEIWKYSLVSGWIKCASLVQGRRNHCGAFIGEVMYICGGFVHSTPSTIDSVESYSTATNKCTTIGKLVHCVQNAGNCVPFKGSLYIFGGIGKDYVALSHVQVYNTKDNTCSVLSKPMPLPYSLMRAALWETSVVLLGWETCFIFNIETETWQERKQFKTDVIHFGLVFENGRIFVIGGGSERDKDGNIIWKCRDDVRYVPLQNIIDDKSIEWMIHGKLPKPSLVIAYANIRSLV